MAIVARAPTSVISSSNSRWWIGFPSDTHGTPPDTAHISLVAEDTGGYVSGFDVGATAPGGGFLAPTYHTTGNIRLGIPSVSGLASGTAIARMIWDPVQAWQLTGNGAVFEQLLRRTTDGLTGVIGEHPPGQPNGDWRTYINDYDLLWQGTRSNTTHYIGRVCENGLFYETWPRPTLTVTGPSPVAGATVNNAIRPTITWTWSGSKAQSGFRVRVFTAAQYGAGGFNPQTSTATYDSGDVLSSATSHQLTTALTNGTTYRAYVWAWQSYGTSTFQHTTFDATTVSALGQSAYSQFTITLVAPPAPTEIFPDTGSVLQTDTPALGATLPASTVSVLVKPEWQLATDAGFTTNLRTITAPDSYFQTGGDFTYVIPAGSSELFQATWYIRVRAVDQNGMTSSYYTGGGTNFSVSHVPSTTNHQPTGQGVRLSPTITFSWLFSDPSPTDYQTAYQVLVERDSDGLDLYDSGKVTSADNSVTQTISTTYVDTLLRWSVRVWDSDDVVSAWSANQQFYMRAAPTVAVTAPPDGGDIPAPSPLIAWSFSATAGRTQASYNVGITENGVSVYDSGWITSSVSQHQVPQPILVFGHTYTITVTVKDSDGLQAVDTQTADADWSPPDNPTVTVTSATFDTEGYVSVSWPQNRDNTFVRYQVWRRIVGDTGWELIAETEDSDEAYVFPDYLAPANASLEYAVTQTAYRFDREVISERVANTVSTASSHYWIITPDDPSLSLRLSHVRSDSFTDEWEQEEIRLLGRGRRVERGTHFGKTGSLDATIYDSNDLTARQQRLNLEAMKVGGLTVKLRTPFGDVWNVVLGDMTVSRIAGVGTQEYVDISLTYSEVAV